MSVSEKVLPDGGCCQRRATMVWVVVGEMPTCGGEKLGENRHPMADLPPPSPTLSPHYVAKLLGG